MNMTAPNEACNPANHEAYTEQIRCTGIFLSETPWAALKIRGKGKKQTEVWLSQPRQTNIVNESGEKYNEQGVWPFERSGGLYINRASPKPVPRSLVSVPTNGINDFISSSGKQNGEDGKEENADYNANPNYEETDNEG